MSTKDSGLRIRIERPLREAFVEVCRKEDKPAAQVIREFMRGYIARRSSQTEGELVATWEQRPARNGNRGKR